MSAIPDCFVLATFHCHAHVADPPAPLTAMGVFDSAARAVLAAELLGGVPAFRYAIYQHTGGVTVLWGTCGYRGVAYKATAACLAYLTNDEAFATVETMAYAVANDRQPR